MAFPTLLPKKKVPPKGVGRPPIKVPRYMPPMFPSQNPVPPRLTRKLADLGKRYRTVRISELVARTLSVAVIVLTLQMFLDWLVELNVLVRALMLAADIGAAVYFIRKRLMPLLRRPPNQEACALMVEKKWPVLRGRVIASVQLGGPRFTADSPELVSTVQAETDARTASMNFKEIVPTRLLQRYALIAATVMGLWLAMMVLTAPGSIALLKRVFLIPAPVPRKTEVICLSGDKIVPAGDSVVLEAQAVGIVPSHGRVTLTDNTGRIQEITMDPERDRSDVFSLKIDRVETSMSYTIRLNDGAAGPFQVKTVPRPNITSIDCTQTYPAYTGLAPIKRSVGNLALLAGSKLTIHAVTNSTIAKAALKLAGVDKTLPVTIGGAEGKELDASIDIPASGLTGFSMEITNQAGITSGDQTQYRIDLIPDRAPSIQLTYPERLQELYTLKAKPTIAFVASDDYGLAKIWLCYRVTDMPGASTDATATATPPPAPKKIEMDLGQGHPLEVKNRYEWDLTAIQPALAEETTLEYWMEADDANNVTGPGVAESEHHTIKIVSDVEKKAEVMSRLMDSFSILNGLSQDQSKINKDLGDVIQAKPADNQAKPADKP